MDQKIAKSSLTKKLELVQNARGLHSCTWVFKVTAQKRPDIITFQK